MHICHVIDNMFLDQGGPVAVVHGLSRAQVGAGDRVTVVCRRQLRPEESRRTEHDLGGAVLREIDGLPDGSAKSRLWRVLSELKPDVLHLHAVWEPIQRHAAAWARRHRIPWVLSSHGMLHPEPMSKGWLKKRVYLVTLGRPLLAATRILVLNTEEASLVEAVFKSKVSIVANGVFMDDAYEPREQGLDIPRDCILFIGRLHPVKGVEDLVRSYALSRRMGVVAELVIAGPDEGSKNSILDVACREGVSQHVHLTGPLYGSNKIHALRTCCLLAHRPVYEGFGLAVAEALAFGTAVVTTLRTGLARQCPEEILAVADDDDEGFARTMFKIWRDARLRLAMRQRASVWAAAHLTWPAIAGQIRDFYLP